MILGQLRENLVPHLKDSGLVHRLQPLTRVCVPHVRSRSCGGGYPPENATSPLTVTRGSAKNKNIVGKGSNPRASTLELFPYRSPMP